MVHTYNGILVDHKKEQNNAICSNMMDPENIMLSEISQTEKDKCYMISQVKSKKMIQMNLFLKQKETHRLQKQTYSYQRGKVGKRDKLGVWDSHIHSTIYEIDNQQGPTV